MEVISTFCPRCGAEYRRGFTTCADCGVPLVHDKPSERPEELEYVEYEEIMRTFNPADLAVVKSLLDAEGITYFFRGENFLMMRPLVEPAALMVKKDEAEIVRDLLRSLNLRYKGISGGT